MNTSANLQLSDGDYDVVLSGALVAGASMPQTVDKLADLFKLPAVKVQALLQQGDVCLKKQVPLAAALKYQQAIERVGAVVVLKPTHVEPMPAPEEVAPQRAEAEKTAVVSPATTPYSEIPRAQVWTLTGLDEPLLTPQEKPPFASRLDDFQNFELKPQEGFILSQEEVQPVLAVAVLEQHWQVADAGALLLTEAEKAGPNPPVVPPQDWSLAAVGEHMSPERAESRSAPDVSHLELAPFNE